MDSNYTDIVDIWKTAKSPKKFCDTINEKYDIGCTPYDFINSSESMVVHTIARAIQNKDTKK